MEKDKVIAPPLQKSAIPGRYQIVMSTVVRADAFLLDTTSGRTWQLTKVTDYVGDPLVWMEVDAIDSKGEIGMTLPEYEMVNVKKRPRK